MPGLLRLRVARRDPNAHLPRPHVLCADALWRCWRDDTVSADLGEVYLDDEWPHGLRCAQCNSLFVDGDRYSARLESFVDDTPLCLVVCVGCALAGEET